MRGVAGARRWICPAIIAALLLFPALLYWDTIFHRYGFRDDYSVLRESHEEPGKVIWFCSMQARPIYGVVMEASFALLRGIEDLAWLRLLSALLVGAVAAVSYRLFRAATWDRATAALLAALIVTLPGAQLLVGWTVGWPLNLALLFTLGAFACAERAFGAERPRLRFGWWAGAWGLVTASALTYQTNTLFYFVPLAAALWPRRAWAWRESFQWFVRHGVTVGLGLVTAFSLMMVAFALEWVPMHQRVGIERDVLGKLGWFVTEPLQNALALTVLNQNYGSPVVTRVAVIVAIILLAGAVREGMRRGWSNGLAWLGALAVLLIGSFSVNLAVSDRWPGYRVLLPLTSVVAVFLAMSLRTLGGRALARIGVGVLVLTGAWLARKQAFELVAQPQGREFALIEKGAATIALRSDRVAKVFVITPTGFDRSTDLSYLDEFGSLSSDSDWVPGEMLAHAMHALHPNVPDLRSRYMAMSGRKLPTDMTFDHVIDLRRLREFRLGNARQ